MVVNIIFSYLSDCTDKQPNCYAYSNDKCGGIYEPWARVNCPYRCGFCLST